MAYIVCEDLAVGYEKKPVVDNINFKVEKGDYLYIVGENGAGKSTLMKTLLHLTTPVSGKITYGDDIKPYEVGYLPQQTIVQKDFPASVYEIVLSGALSKSKMRPFYSKELKNLARENMEKMGIWDMRKKCYRNLSGGQQQRVLLARALTATTKLLLLDEPVSGLDPRVTAEMYTLINDLNKDGITIIMVSHDIEAAVKYAKTILHVEGEKSFFGTREEYMNSKEYKMFMGISGHEEYMKHEDSSVISAASEKEVK